MWAEILSEKRWREFSERALEISSTSRPHGELAKKKDSVKSNT